jgi:ABC-type phosphate transport system permease subunit
MEAGTLTRGDRSAFERSPQSRLPDQVLRWGLLGIALAILVLIAYFFIRLIGEAQPVFSDYGIFKFIFSNEWVPSQGKYGALPLVVGTLVSSAIALIIGVPIAVSSSR